MSPLFWGTFGRRSCQNSAKVNNSLWRQNLHSPRSKDKITPLGLVLAVNPASIQSAEHSNAPRLSSSSYFRRNNRALVAKNVIRRLMILRITPTSSRHQKGDDIPAAALFLLLQGNIIARLLPHLLPLQGIYLLPAENHLLLFLRLHSRQSI